MKQLRSSKHLKEYLAYKKMPIETLLKKLNLKNIIQIKEYDTFLVIRELDSTSITYAKVDDLKIPLDKDYLVIGPEKIVNDVLTLDILIYQAFFPQQVKRNLKLSKNYSGIITGHYRKTKISFTCNENKCNISFKWPRATLPVFYEIEIVQRQDIPQTRTNNYKSYYIFGGNYTNLLETIEAVKKAGNRIVFSIYKQSGFQIYLL